MFAPFFPAGAKRPLEAVSQQVAQCELSSGGAGGYGAPAAQTVSQGGQRPGDDAPNWRRLLGAASSKESRSSGEGCLAGVEMTNRWP